MSTQSSSNRAALRAFVVAALAVVVFALSLPDIRRVWQPSGDFGFTSDFDNVINFLAPHFPAEQAGLKLGDWIDVAATDPAYRFSVGVPGTLVPGQQVKLILVDGAQRRDVSLRSEPEVMDDPTKAIILSREFAMLLFVVTGAALVLLRPSVATWAFYFYCLGLNGAPFSIAMLSGSPWSWLALIAEMLLYPAGLVGIVVFAALFLHPEATGWRYMVYRSSALAWLLCVGLYTYIFIGSRWLGWRAGAVSIVWLYLEAALLFLAIYAFADTYLRSRGTDRQRIRMVVFGFGVALAVSIVLNFLVAYINPPYWLRAGLLVLPIVAPLTVAYAVIKHRVIDASFVVSRTLVYTVMTTFLVGILSFIDWFFIEKLKLVRLGTIAEVAAAVGIGFWFNGLHKRIDWLIDATFFRQRHRAERQLAQIAASLPHLTKIKAIAEALVAEPVRALALASGALFRRGQDGLYVREESVGWRQEDIARLDDSDDRLIALLLTEQCPVSLHDHPWRREGVPIGSAQPILAVPLIVRRELAAVVFYGSHVHGEALDPDEIKAIAGLAPGAAAAYDHLEAEAMKREVESMRRELETVRGMLAEAQIQPT